ncbi:MAG: Crp/Fnr family transcriptional regulator [Deltaproteobacteria bacterium]|nr:Crp/Fnr family transcriptional regulator [Deltaproteobacteria bacterium]
MVRAPQAAPDRAALAAHLRRDGLSDADLALAPPARIIALARDQAVLSAGDRAVDAGVVLTGALREFYPLADGREVTRGFAGPGAYLGSLSDLLAEAPARSTIAAEVASTVALIPWAAIRALAATHPGWAAMVHRVTERLYLAKAEREYELLALDAAARYQRFRARYAALEPVIRQRHVASYIGVTPEHLSRLRAREPRPATGQPRSPARTRR